MRSRKLIDPELLAGLDNFPSFAFTDAILPVARQAMAEKATAAPIDKGLRVEVEERRIATSDGHELALLLYVPLARAGMRPAVLHIHGGGYILGSARMSQPNNMAVAVAADCVIASVDYRLAPETRHPGPVEDCYAALKWLHEHAASLNIDPARIAVMGESAGGGLAAALALLARDRGEIALVHQHLIAPMLDDRTCIAERHPFAGEFVWTPDANRFGWSALLGSEPGSEGVSAYAAAARADNLAGLPSTFISVGALDLFVTENMDYSARLMRAGVSTELHVYPGAYHAFGNVATAEVARKARHDAMIALRRALHPV